VSYALLKDTQRLTSTLALADEAVVHVVVLVVYQAAGVLRLRCHPRRGRQANAPRQRYTRQEAGAAVAVEAWTRADRATQIGHVEQRVFRGL
jgi:hypothetical protein